MKCKHCGHHLGLSVHERNARPRPGSTTCVGCRACDAELNNKEKRR